MRKLWVSNKFGSAKCKSANCKKYWVRKLQIRKLQIHEKNLKQKILWHCPFKAKHQHTQECTDVTSQNFIKLLSLETIPLKSSNSIYKNTTPSYGVKEVICRRMPRNFFSSAQFQRKRKSLVFFQSINFLCWPPLSPIIVSMKCIFCKFLR